MMRGELLTEAAFEVSLEYAMVTCESLRATEHMLNGESFLIIHPGGSESSVLTPQETARGLEFDPENATQVG
jgi:hypothetical protein